jgi:long-chain acyl-CoA synthetase
MSLSLASIILESARRFPKEVALIQDGKTWTYEQLKDQVLRLAAYLRSVGVGPGTRLSVMCGNRPEFTISYYGAIASGATVVTLNTLLVADEITYQLENSESVGIIAEAEVLAPVLEAVSRVESCRWVALAAFDRKEGGELAKGIKSLGEIIEETSPLESFVATRPDDTAVVMYTSGTTGRPKGAELTHFNLWENARVVSERSFATSETEIYLVGPGHVALALLPLFHSFGQTCVQNGLLFNGGAITYMKRYDAEKVVEVIARDRVTILNAVPTIYNGLIHATSLDPSLLATLKFGFSGGAALPLDVRRAFEEQYKMPILEGYGLTETSPVACSQNQWTPIKLGSIGRPIPGVDMKIFDEHDQEVPAGAEGEVVIRGRNIMKGYLNQPDATAQVMRSGWFHSGDIGKVDEDGDFYIVDRKKDMIIRGGFNVYPREVEEVLYAHPDIREASIIGIPDPHYGEEVKAVVCLKEGAHLTAEELIAYCKQHVAAYKYPRVVVFAEELPKGPTGKVLKREIRRMFAEQGTH